MHLGLCFSRFTRLPTREGCKCHMKLVFSFGSLLRLDSSSEVRQCGNNLARHWLELCTFGVMIDFRG